MEYMANGNNGTNYFMYILICMILMLALAVVAIFIWKSKINKQIGELQRIADNINNGNIVSKESTQEQTEPDEKEPAEDKKDCGSKEQSMHEDVPEPVTSAMPEAVIVSRTEPEEKPAGSNVVIKDIFVGSADSKEDKSESTAVNGFISEIWPSGEKQDNERVHIVSEKAGDAVKTEQSPVNDIFAELAAAGRKKTEKTEGLAKSGRVYAKSEIESIIMD